MQEKLGAPEAIAAAPLSVNSATKDLLSPLRAGSARNLLVNPDRMEDWQIPRPKKDIGPRNDTGKGFDNLWDIETASRNSDARRTEPAGPCSRYW